MRTSITSMIAAALVCAAGSSVAAGDAQKIPLHVLYLSRQNGGARAEAFTQFLSGRFERCTALPRDEFKLTLARDADVVVMDWSQQERRSDKYLSPLGPLETWETPIVLLGSAGLLMAGPWNIIGGAG